VLTGHLRPGPRGSHGRRGGGHCADAGYLEHTYTGILEKHGDARVEYMERFAFCERTKTAYAVVAMGESAICTNIILKKGVVKE